MFPALMRDSITSLSSRAVAEVLWARSGLGPADIDVAQLYDCFTITLLLQLEDYGFAKRGDGGAFAADGGIGLDGPLPCNTSGGHLSEGYTHGVQMVIENVRQLRHRADDACPGWLEGKHTYDRKAGCRQVKDARICCGMAWGY